MREIIHLVSEDGKSRYVMKKNRREHQERLELMKYSKHERKHVLHRERR
jgi:ribosomal protein L33